MSVDQIMSFELCDQYFGRENHEMAMIAILKDDVDELKGVLDGFPEFNTMIDTYGQNLLEFACDIRGKKTFDYLLNLNCFDLESGTHGHSTILFLALNLLPDDDYFVVKLIDAGADVYRISNWGETYLHCAIRSNLLESTKLLLEKGVDPNAQDDDGYTALHILLAHSTADEMDEYVNLLLQYGADTAILDNEGYLPFDRALTCKKIKLSTQEHLFYCTFDSHSADYKMRSDFLIDLKDSPLFNNVMDVVSEVIVRPYFVINIFTVRSDILEKIIERFAYVFEDAILRMMPHYDTTMNINNVDILVNSELHFEMVQLISKLDLWKIYLDNHIIMSKEELSSLILYLLSYGLNVTCEDCHGIYSFQGYSDLFKTMLLHLGCSHCSNKMGDIFMNIDYNVNIAVGYIVHLHHTEDSCDSCRSDKIKLILDYFVNSELRLFCERSGNPDLIDKVKQSPTVPSLLQLARDATKRHIVRRYKLKKTSQFYWVLGKLGIPTAHQEILSFRTKLYG